MAQYDKFQKLKLQYSLDGVTWYDVQPPQFKMGELIEKNSPDCGGTVTIYRWYASPDEYVCSNYNKYYKEYYQQSTDNGLHWTNVEPEQTRTGQLIESNSSDCGYGLNYKLVKGEYICDFEESTNSYNIYYKYQKYIGDTPATPAEYQKGEKIGEYSNLINKEDCESGLYFKDLFPCVLYYYSESSHEAGYHVTMNLDGIEYPAGIDPIGIITDKEDPIYQGYYNVMGLRYLSLNTPTDGSLEVENIGPRILPGNVASSVGVAKITGSTIEKAATAFNQIENNNSVQSYLNDNSKYDYDWTSLSKKIQNNQYLVNSNDTLADYPAIKCALRYRGGKWRIPSSGELAFLSYDKNKDTYYRKLYFTQLKLNMIFGQNTVHPISTVANNESLYTITPDSNDDTNSKVIGITTENVNGTNVLNFKSLPADNSNPVIIPFTSLKISDDTITAFRWEKDYDGYICEDGNKYERYILMDGDNIVPGYQMKGELIEEGSSDCSMFARAIIYDGTDNKFFSIDENQFDLVYGNTHELTVIGVVVLDLGEIEGHPDYMAVIGTRYNSLDSPDEGTYYFDSFTDKFKVNAENLSLYKSASDLGIDDPLNTHSCPTENERLCQYAINQDWKTSTIIQSDEIVAQSLCTWRYHTPGTKQGDWYIPFAGDYAGLCDETDKTNVEKIDKVNKMFDKLKDISPTIAKIYYNSTTYDPVYYSTIQKGNDNNGMYALSYSTGSPSGAFVEEMNFAAYSRPFLLMDKNLNIIHDLKNIYRWSLSEGEFICENGNKYEKYIYQYSQDNGQHWTNVEPEQTKKGELIEEGSADCSMLGKTILYDNTESKFVSMNDDEIDAIDDTSRYTPIGIVVVDTGVNYMGTDYPDEMVVMGLVYNNNETPDTGSVDVVRMDVDKTNLFKNLSQLQVKQANMAFSCPSENLRLCNYSIQPNWQTTTNTITMLEHPVCAWRYHTVGTKQGDWYIPFGGEYIGIKNNKNKIKATLQKLKNKFTENDIALMGITGNQTTILQGDSQFEYYVFGTGLVKISIYQSAVACSRPFLLMDKNNLNVVKR